VHDYLPGKVDWLAGGLHTMVVTTPEGRLLGVAPGLAGRLGQARSPWKITTTTG